jgi:hypothetical protein
MAILRWSVYVRGIWDDVGAHNNSNWVGDEFGYD